MHTWMHVECLYRLLILFRYVHRCVCKWGVSPNSNFDRDKSDQAVDFKVQYPIFRHTHIFKSYFYVHSTMVPMAAPGTKHVVARCHGPRQRAGLFACASQRGPMFVNDQLHAKRAMEADHIFRSILGVS